MFVMLELLLFATVRKSHSSKRELSVCYIKLFDRRYPEAAATKDSDKDMQ